MKTNIRFTVPPTREQGSHSGTASASYGETLAQSALWDYNSARAHDGLPPLARMPAGTVYHRPARTYYVQRKGQGYLETVDEFTTRTEARAMLAEYRMADPSAVYYLSTRPCKGWTDETPPATFATNGGTYKARNGGKRSPLNLAHSGQ